MKNFSRYSAIFRLIPLLPMLTFLPSKASAASELNKFEILGATIGDTYASAINKILSNGGKLTTVRAEISQMGWFYATYLQFSMGSYELGQNNVTVIAPIYWDNSKSSRNNKDKSFYRWSLYDDKPFDVSFFPDYVKYNPVVFIVREQTSSPKEAPLSNAFKNAVSSKYGPYIAGKFEYNDAFLWPYSQATQKEHADLCIRAFEYPDGATDDWGINRFFEAYKMCQKIGWLVANFANEEIDGYRIGVFDYDSAIKHMIEFNRKREESIKSEKTKRGNMRENPKF